MKLHFLGTAPGKPMKDRFCVSTMLECGGKYYLFDSGAPVTDIFARQELELNKIAAVCITHSHGDHSYGLPLLASFCSYGVEGAKWELYMPEKDSLDALRTFIRVCDVPVHEEKIGMHVIAAGEIFRDENVAVTAVPTRHRGDGKPSFAFVIDGEGKRVIITGDLKPGTAEDFPQIAKEEPSAAIVCEMGHFPPAVIFPHMEACPTKHFFYHHVYWQDAETLQTIADADKRLPFRVRSVKDGEIWEI